MTIGLRYGTVDSVCIAGFDLPFVVQKQKIVSLADRGLGNCSRDLLQDELFDLRILSLVTIESESLANGGGSVGGLRSQRLSRRVGHLGFSWSGYGDRHRRFGGGCSSSSATIVFFFFMIVPAKLGFIQTV